MGFYRIGCNLNTLGCIFVQKNARMMSTNKRRSITIRQYKPTTVMIASLVDDLDEDATRAVYMVVRELHDRKKPQKQNTIQMT